MWYVLYYLISIQLDNIFFAAIRVGYNRTVINTMEGDMYVILCAVIFEPATGVAPRPFTLTYETSDGTAGNKQD